MRKAYRQIILLLCCGLFGWLATGCGVSLEGKNLSHFEVLLFDGSRRLTPSEGLMLGESYRIEVHAHLHNGEVITNPKYEELELLTSNESVQKKLQFRVFKGYFLRVSDNSLGLRKENISFGVRLKNGGFSSRPFEYSIRWRDKREFAFDSVNGYSGRNGGDGATGTSQDGLTSPQSGEHGEHGENGVNGRTGAPIDVYAAYLRENITGKDVVGLLLKIVVAGGTPRFHYTRAKLVSIASYGGIGGDGGHGGNGGRGGDATEIPSSEPLPETLFAGGLGGHGGDGGAGGLGGDGGRITLYYLGDAKERISLTSEGGKGGKGGNGGEAGAGGYGSTEDLDAAGGEPGRTGPNGADGSAGAMRINSVSLDEIYEQFKQTGIQKSNLVVR